MFGLFGHSTRTYGVLVDIGSGSIGIGIIRSERGKTNPELIYTHREYIKINEQPSPDERVRAMRQTLFSAFLELSETGFKKLHAYDPHGSIKHLLVVCAAPWSQTVTQTLSLEKEKPIEVNREWIEDLIEKAQKQNPASKREGEILEGVGMTIVERSVVDIRLNGYAVEDPYGKKARELSVAHLTGLIPTKVLDVIQEARNKMLTHTEVRTQTYALVLYCAIRDLFPDTQNALIVDVSGEATEIGIISDDILFDTVAIPYGSFTLSRALAQKLNTIPEEARTHLSSTAHSKENEKIRTAIKDVASEFGSELHKGLSKLSESYALPRTVFITTDRELEDQITTNLKRVYKQVSGHNIDTITVLGSRSGSKTTEALQKVLSDTSGDVFLAIVARFFHKLQTHEEIEPSHNSGILKS